MAYAGGGAYGSTWQSRYMLGSGIVIAAFIVYHLAHFTALLPGINGVGDFSKLKTVLHGETVPDVYGMMILGFQVWWVALFYLVAQALLFIHLGHGLASLFQTLRPAQSRLVAADSMLCPGGEHRSFLSATR